MTAQAGRMPLAAPLSPIPLRRRLLGFGSVFGKTLRDSRLAVIIVPALLGGMALVGGGSMSSTYATLEARQELAAMSTSLPPVMRGLYGNPVNVETLGGFITWHYGAYIALLAGLWSILALSGTLAGEARRGSLEFVIAAPLSRARIALEKIAGHLVALAVAMALVALAAWAAGVVYAKFPGDEIAPGAAAGFAAGIGLRALIAGSIAFALASVVGRGAAAGLAGALMFGGYVVTSYRAVVPAFDAVAGLSWLGWTADHLPLAGRWDWGSLAWVAVVSAALLALGVAIFMRGDVGVTRGIRTPGLPPAVLGVRGPVSRSFGEVLPIAVAWGVGLGFYALVMATASRAFADELAKIPSLAELVRNILPGVDMTTASGFLEVLFIDFGLVFLGLAAATFVGDRAGDETAGRLELQLATPLTRVRWAVAAGVGAWLGIAVVTALLAIAIGVGVAAAGGDVLVPVAGTLVLALYGAALVGIGFAVGGLAGPSFAGPVVAAFAIGTFLVDVLAPALKLPDWLHQLALSTHVGQPMVGTWDLNGIAACLVLAVGGLALGAWGFSRRDLAG